MTEKTTYIAFDGKEFNSKENCIEYEAGCFLEVYDENGEILDNENESDIANLGKYVICKTKEALLYFNISCKQNYVDPIVYEKNIFPVSFTWGEGSWGWHNIKDLIAEYQVKIDILSKYLED